MSLRLREGRAMSNFVSWSYNGEIEYGYAPDEKNRIGDYHLEGVEFDRKRSQVTNLRPAKVVEADAVSNDAVCPSFACQCEPNQVTKDAIEEARNRNDTR